MKAYKNGANFFSDHPVYYFCHAMTVIELSHDHQRSGHRNFTRSFDLPGAGAAPPVLSRNESVRPKQSLLITQTSAATT